MILRSLPLILTSLLASALRSHGLIIPGPAGVANSTESSLTSWLSDNSKPAFSYWDNIVRVSDASGIYLGSSGGYGWVLTAAHVTPLATGTQSISVDGTSYLVRDNVAIGAQDMRLYRIGGESGDPALPALSNIPIAGSTPVIGTALLDFGAGERVEGTLNSALSSDAQLGSNATRFEWAGAGTLRWGTNTTANASPAYSAFELPPPGGPTPTVPNTTQGNTETFVSVFNDPGVSYLNATESAVGNGDSGGPVFTVSGGQWQLSGINEYLLPTSSAVSTTGFGDYSGYVNLAAYRSGILAAMVPEPSSAALAAGAILLGHGRRRRVRS